jgi:hypothetical protein
MMWALLGLALAGGFTHRTTRAPLPARWVERPVVLPAGWKQLDLQVGPGGVLSAQGRLSLGPAVELRAGGATDDTAQPVEIGAALALGRREAPARSAALTLGWQVPRLATVAPSHRIVLGLPLRRQWGGSRWTAGPVADVTTADTWASRVGARGEVGLQAGPLGATLEATAWMASGADVAWQGALGAFVQLNRALRLHGAQRLGDAQAPSGVVGGLELSL